jgi:hypothetical protein
MSPSLAVFLVVLGPVCGVIVALVLSRNAVIDL